MSTQYLMILCLIVAKLATLVDFRENIIPTAFWVTRSRSHYWSSYQQCPLNILGTIFYWYDLENKGQYQCGSKCFMTCFILSLNRISNNLNLHQFIAYRLLWKKEIVLNLIIWHWIVTRDFFFSYYQPIANIETLNRKSLLNIAICLFNIW